MAKFISKNPVRYYVQSDAEPGEGERRYGKFVSKTGKSFELTDREYANRLNEAIRGLVRRGAITRK